MLKKPRQKRGFFYGYNPKNGWGNSFYPFIDLVLQEVIFTANYEK